ncbi:hypothetical protein EJD96_05130 [Herbaspirillum seropedicae]|uniref:hypothetical protein n=1 Tax=Herbaspirillum seropedicae TaxID=964 RepID=UPI00112381F3|nr:hypothetical protein [Herbaspirillum seropedicae]QDD63571.1 hypothetical protein EJD96_05130 [Herbaspirillum seropedicae]
MKNVKADETRSGNGFWRLGVFFDAWWRIKKLTFFSGKRTMFFDRRRGTLSGSVRREVAVQEK